MSGDWANLVAVALAFAAILVAAEAGRGLGADAEWTRKLVHVLSGIVSAGFPWLFDGPAPVALLASSYIALMAVSRRLGWLRAVHGVKRRTAGGYWYPAAVAVAFGLAGRHPEAYVAGILALAVGDAAAALVGRRFGATRYRFLGATRSLEGSIAMAAAVYPCVHVPLALLTPLGPLACAVWSLHVALLSALIEAASPRGSDNFFVPVAACVSLLGAAEGPPPVAGLVAVIAVLTVALACVSAASARRQGM